MVPIIDPGVKQDKGYSVYDSGRRAGIFCQNPEGNEYVDIGGFDSDTNAQLLQDWMKACFLFPVCRNHTAIGTRAQEPWAFGSKVMQNLRHYIRLRYRFRPYLYNLFIRHAETGASILRPLFHDFEDSVAQPLGTIDDQFLVGAAVMQAPFLIEGQKRRRVVLPGRGRLAIETEALARGVGTAKASFVLYDRFACVTLDGKPVGVKPVSTELAGKKQTLWKVV